MNTPTHYTLNEYGEDWLEFTSLDVNGYALVFDSYEGAVDMAKWMLEVGGEAGQLPLVSILGWDANPWAMLNPDIDHEEYDVASLPTDDIPSYACGWVEAKDISDSEWVVTAHDGDYENDEGLWSRMPKAVK